MKARKLLVFILAMITLVACTPGQSISSNPQDDTSHVLASTSFLADLAQNIAGDRFVVETLLPLGIDPHAFQPKPSDAAKVAASTVLILNGTDYEHFIGPLLENAGGKRLVIDASAGLTPRPSPDDLELKTGDPHFWLDPNMVIKYVENIRDGFISTDPAGADVYKANAEEYIQQLKDLDAWIKMQVDSLPPENRLLVTNHEALGYFADRYGFTIVGAVIPSLSSEASPSAKEMADLVNQIRANHVTAIFLDAVDNPALAKQIANDANVKVITTLHLESLTSADGPASTYIDMMKYNTEQIVNGCRS